jgi:hypothetical protein
LSSLLDSWVVSSETAHAGEGTARVNNRKIWKNDFTVGDYDGGLVRATGILFGSSVTFNVIVTSVCSRTRRHE